MRYVLKQMPSFRPGWRFHRLDTDVSTWHLLPGLMKELTKELNMPNYTHILELKEGNPNQYRITVVEDTVTKIMEAQMGKDTDGFVVLGYYATSEEMMAVLEPHLAMEHSKGT